MDKIEVKNVMPARFLSAGVRKDTDAALRRAERDINDLANKLASMREIPEIPKDIKRINKDFIDSVFAPRMEAVRNDLGLTEDERDEKARLWQRICATAQKYANSIIEILEQWPEVNWQWDEESSHFIAANLHEVVDIRSTFDTPKEARQHYKLIHDALKAVSKLREWEQLQDAKTVSLITLVRLTPSQLAEAWYNGDAKVNHRFDHLGIRHDDFKGTIII